MASGQPESPSAVLTRELRWFVDGPLPSHLLEWFTYGMDFEVERRVDYYDVPAARRGVGVKRRSTTSFDSKFRVFRIENVKVGPRLVGHVEDWLKISEPASSRANEELEAIEVKKELFTRSFAIPGADGAGCEVELAAIEAGSIQAWSLCFESYGEPALRADALDSGVAGLVAESPFPRSNELGPESCRGYPEWIGSLTLETA